MNGLDRVIDYIKSEAAAQCEEITRYAAEECARLKSEYAQTEQDEYWKSIDVGTKEAERRMERLNTLAEMESNKQILATQQEMISEAFELAAKKLSELHKADYAALLNRLGMKSGTKPEEIVARYKNELSPRVASVLFN